MLVIGKSIITIALFSAIVCGAFPVWRSLHDKIDEDMVENREAPGLRKNTLTNN
jgi:hypothetical protein